MAVAHHGLVRGRRGPRLGLRLGSNRSRSLEPVTIEGNGIVMALGGLYDAEQRHLQRSNRSGLVGSPAVMPLEPHDGVADEQPDQGQADHDDNDDEQRRQANQMLGPVGSLMLGRLMHGNRRDCPARLGLFYDDHDAPKLGTLAGVGLVGGDDWANQTGDPLKGSVGEPWGKFARPSG